jgi:hypothetical protein
MHEVHFGSFAKVEGLVISMLSAYRLINSLSTL